MINGRQPTVFNVVPLGNVDIGAVSISFGQANLVQSCFRFEWNESIYPLSKRYKLPNGGFDLDSAAVEAAQKLEFSGPTIFVTSAPYGVPKSTQLFFCDFGIGDNKNISIISTDLWDQLPPPRRPQPYILHSLATAVLSHCAGLEFHEETHGCLFDYCDDISSIDLSFAGGGLCDTCRQHLNRCLRDGKINIMEAASSIRLRNRGAGRKSCFVAMPFNRKFEPIYEIITETLGKVGWSVYRADEVGYPRRITDAIMMQIFSADLVLAELTGGNPNVFYEVGFAHAAGCDTILMTQEERIPFDVVAERTIIYRPEPSGIKDMTMQLARFAGKGTF